MAQIWKVRLPGGNVSILYTRPLALIMLGASLGKSAVRAKRTETTIRIIGGVLLIVAGFYLLGTF